ncbi:MAG TPA: hypothetical protein VJC37_03960 [Planctomycetota bacterium]|nr:hypothetical protein [Planctomycetota bacterium]
MFITLAKYFEPVIFGLIFIVCILELIKVRGHDEPRDAQDRKYQILWILLPFILLALIILKLVWF